MEKTAKEICRECEGRGWNPWEFKGEPRTKPCIRCDGSGRVESAALHESVAQDQVPAVDKCWCGLDRVLCLHPKAHPEPERGTARDEIKLKADNAYCNFIEQMKRPDCLGFEAKVKSGEFSKANLEAFQRAYTEYGKHVGLHEAMLIIDRAPSPLPVRGQTSTRGKSLSAILGAVDAALSGKKVLLATARGNVKLERYAPQPEELTITVDEFVDAIAGEKEE